MLGWLTMRKTQLLVLVHLVRVFDQKITYACVCPYWMSWSIKGSRHDLVFRSVRFSIVSNVDTVEHRDTTIKDDGVGSHWSCQILNPNSNEYIHFFFLEIHTSQFFNVYNIKCALALLSKKKKSTPSFWEIFYKIISQLKNRLTFYAFKNFIFSKNDGVLNWSPNGNKAVENQSLNGISKVILGSLSHPLVSVWLQNGGVFNCID